MSLFVSAPKCQDIVLGAYMNVRPQEHKPKNMHAHMKLIHTEKFSVFYKLS